MRPEQGASRRRGTQRGSVLPRAVCGSAMLQAGGRAGPLSRCSAGRLKPTICPLRDGGAGQRPRRPAVTLHEHGCSDPRVQCGSKQGRVAAFHRWYPPPLAPMMSVPNARRGHQLSESLPSWRRRVPERAQAPRSGAQGERAFRYNLIDNPMIWQLDVYTVLRSSSQEWSFAAA